MKNPFKSGPDDGFVAAQFALDHANEKIKSLELERESRLFALEEGYIDEISRIDRELSIEHANTVIHRDRLNALRLRSRDQARIKREREKAAAIPEIKKRFARRQAAAEKLDQLLKQTADCLAELIAADEAVFERWPSALPPASRLSYLRATTLDPLSSRRIQRPISAGIIRELANRVPFDVAAAVEKSSRELIDELESAPAPDLPDEEGIAA
jgi:hypothetical protein